MTFYILAEVTIWYKLINEDSCLVHTCFFILLTSLPSVCRVFWAILNWIPKKKFCFKFPSLQGLLDCYRLALPAYCSLYFSILLMETWLDLYIWNTDFIF